MDWPSSSVPTVDQSVTPSYLAYWPSKRVDSAALKSPGSLRVDSATSQSFLTALRPEVAGAKNFGGVFRTDVLLEEIVEEAFERATDLFYLVDGVEGKLGYQHDGRGRAAAQP